MPHARDLAGSLLDERYELHAVVGEGTFGRVYRGRDRRLARTVAVKVIKPWWTEDPKWAQAFQREARLLARISDPGIVQIFDVGQAPEGLYYVAEYVDGDSLAGQLSARRLSPWEAAAIAERLCRALSCAHTQGIVHRDINPANVLLSGRGELKLTDFGVARLGEGSTGAGSGTVVGTPRYMSPEQARGLPTTPATDTYSVGVVLYEMLAGHPPFTGTSPVELALSHLNDVPPPLPEGIPGPLVQIVEQALAKDPAHRFPDAGSLAEALACARAGESRPRPAEDGLSGTGAEGGQESAAVGRRPGAGSAVALAGPMASGPPEGADAGGAPRRPDPTRVAPPRFPRPRVSAPGSRRSIAAIAVVVLILIAMVVTAIALAPPAHVRVPVLRGLNRAAIQVKARQFHVRTLFASRYNSAPAGTAIAQDPAAGTQVDTGSVVQVTLSGGPPPVELPSLVGQSSSSATTILRSLGLNPRFSSVPAPGVPAGTVTGQSPRAGGFVSRHTRVSLSVAETPRWRPLTSVSGSGAAQSVPFRIRGTQWRIVDQMSYVGTCTFIFFCDGPTAHVVDLHSGAGPTP